MAKYVFPAVFKKEEKLYYVYFPDLENCFTQGDNLTDAYEMAQDVLELCLYDMEEDEKEIPKATDINELELKPGEFSTLVKADTMTYRKINSNKAVKKTLTIPSWLNEIAEREGINYSYELQTALKQKLNIK